MGIQQISIRVDDDMHAIPVTGSLVCISEMYLNFLSKLKSPKRIYINLYMTDIPTKFNKLEFSSGFWDYYKQFDAATYQSLTDNFSRKKFLTQWLNEAMVYICGENSWDINACNEAYSKCEKLQFTYHGYFGKKWNKSPDGILYFSLKFLCDLHNYEIWEELYDHNKKLISSRMCFKDQVPVFRIQTIIWDSNSELVYYTFHGPKKRFIVQIEELKNKIPIQVNIPSSRFFKE